MPTILLADDDATQRRVIHGVLRDKLPDLEVLEASDGTAAVALFRGRDDIAMALIDIAMPGIDGLEVIHQMVELQADRDDKVQIVALTAHDDEATTAAVFAEGAVAFLPKPASAAGLKLTAHQIVSLLEENGHLPEGTALFGA